MTVARVSFRELGGMGASRGRENDRFVERRTMEGFSLCLSVLLCSLVLGDGRDFLFEGFSLEALPRMLVEGRSMLGKRGGWRDEWVKP